MPVIDLGVDYSSVEDMDKFDPMPNGTYEFSVASIEEKTSQKGRPMLKWTFRIPFDGSERKLSYFTVLPWQKDGEWDLSGMGMLVSVTKALGRPWTGQSLSTEDFLGLGGQMEVVQKPKQIKGPDGVYTDDPDGDVVNDIKKFVY